MAHENVSRETSRREAVAYIGRGLYHLPEGWQDRWLAFCEALGEPPEAVLADAIVIHMDNCEALVRRLAACPERRT